MRLLTSAAVLLLLHAAPAAAQDVASFYKGKTVRIVVGFLFACHGAQKLFGLLGGFGPSGGTAPLFSLMGLAGIIEFLGGLCMMLGWWTGSVAFIASGMMAVAYFQFHWKLQSGLAFLPTVNKGELAVLYCFIFLYIACRGGVKWSLDKKSK
jgi:putative oxidoreductase